MKRDSQPKSLAPEAIRAYGRALMAGAGPVRMVSLAPARRRGLGGRLFRSGPRLVYAVAGALSRHEVLFPDVPVHGAELADRQTRALALRGLRDDLLYLTRLVSDTYLDEQAAVLDEAIGVLRQAQQTGTLRYRAGFPDPEDRLGALAEALRIQRGRQSAPALARRPPGPPPVADDRDLAALRTAVGELQDHLKRLGLPDLKMNRQERRRWRRRQPIGRGLRAESDRAVDLEELLRAAPVLRQRSGHADAELLRRRELPARMRDVAEEAGRLSRGARRAQTQAGLALRDVFAAIEGALAAELEAGAPAERAGLERDLSTLRRLLRADGRARKKRPRGTPGQLTDSARRS